MERANTAPQERHCHLFFGYGARKRSSIRTALPLVSFCVCGLLAQTLHNNCIAEGFSVTGAQIQLHTNSVAIGFIWVCGLSAPKVPKNHVFFGCSIVGRTCRNTQMVGSARGLYLGGSHMQHRHVLGDGRSARHAGHLAVCTAVRIVFFPEFARRFLQAAIAETEGMFPRSSAGISRCSGLCMAVRNTFFANCARRLFKAEGAESVMHHKHIGCEFCRSGPGCKILAETREPKVCGVNFVSRGSMLLLHFSYLVVLTESRGPNVCGANFASSCFFTPAISWSRPKHGNRICVERILWVGGSMWFLLPYLSSDLGRNTGTESVCSEPCEQEEHVVSSPRLSRDHGRNTGSKCVWSELCEQGEHVVSSPQLSRDLGRT